MDLRDIIEHPRSATRHISAGAVMALSLAALFPTIANAAGADDLYARCSTCHKVDGSGTPGVAPPLKDNVAKLAETSEGRRYLALVVIKGVSGPLTINGARFMGFMPGQPGMTDEQVASVLNTMIADKAASKAKSFNATEIAGYRADAAQTSAAAVGKSRP